MYDRRRSKIPICYCYPESTASSPRMHVDQNRRSQVRVDRPRRVPYYVCLSCSFRAKWFVSGCSRLDDLPIPFLMAVLASLLCKVRASGWHATQAHVYHAYLR